MGVEGDGSAEGVRVFAGDRGLNTENAGIFLSGVFGRGSAEGPEAILSRTEITGGFGNSVREDETGTRVVDRGRDVITGSGAAEGDGVLSSWGGRDAFAAASFVCRFCTFRVRVSTFPSSFLFSLSILVGYQSMDH